MRKKKDDLPPPTFPEQFVYFSKYENAKSDGKTMQLSQSDKWMKQAEMIGVTKISTTDTGLCFMKFKKHALTFVEYKKFLQDVAKTKGLPYDDMITQMTECGFPGEPPTSATPVVKPLA